MAEQAHLNEVNLYESVERRRLDDVENRDDVFVVEPPKEFDLAEGSEAEHCWRVGRNEERGLDGRIAGGGEGAWRFRFASVGGGSGGKRDKVVGR